MVGRGLVRKVPMRYQPGQIGIDRVVNLYGARAFYRLPLLVIDFGTAITFDYLSEKGIFEGGLIVPGMELAWRALEDRAALLPKLGRLKAVRDIAARSTAGAMSAGLLYGFGAMTDGLIERFRHRFKKKCRVLATGGGARQIAPYSRHVRAGTVDPLHTLRSLVLLCGPESLKGQSK